MLDPFDLTLNNMLGFKIYNTYGVINGFHIWLLAFWSLILFRQRRRMSTMLAIF
jgi:hypothetical protein